MIQCCISDLTEEDFINISVSGMKYETLKSTLRRFPNTLLSDRKKRKPYYNDETRCYYFDRNREGFEAILYYYQSGYGCIFVSKTHFVYKYLGLYFYYLYDTFRYFIFGLYLPKSLSYYIPIDFGVVCVRQSSWVINRSSVTVLCERFFSLDSSSGWKNRKNEPLCRLLVCLFHFSQKLQTRSIPSLDESFI